MNRRLGSSFTVGFVVGLLVLAGAASYAYWTVSAHLGARAHTATVGVELSGGSGLDVAYGDAVKAAGAAFTLRNTGSRDGVYTLVVTPEGTGVGSAVSARIGVVARSEDCTASAQLGSPVTGTLGSAFAHTGQLGAGSTVVVCVQTSMTDAGIASHGGASLAATVSGSIAVGEWTRSASPVLFAQSVQAAAAPAAAPVVTKPGWHFLRPGGNAALCVATVNYHGPEVDQKSCVAGTPDDQLWRFADTGDGHVRIVSKTGNRPWLQAGSAQRGGAVTVGTTGSDLGKWLLLSSSGGVRFALLADPTLCLAPAGSGAGARMVLASCDAAGSAFTLVEQGDSAPQPVILGCRTDGYNAYLEWPQLSGYQGEVAYRVRVDGQLSTIHSRAGGWDTVAQFGWDRFVATYPAGTHTIVVEQSVFGGAWTTTGTGTLTSAASAPYFRCGS